MTKRKIFVLLASLGLVFSTIGCDEHKETTPNEEQSGGNEQQGGGEQGGETTKTLQSIAVTSQPTKAAYEVGEQFASAGLVVTGTYSDQSTAAVTGYTLSPAEGYTFVEADIGQKEFTVTYEQKTAAFSVTVSAATPRATGIRVAQEPTKVNYKVGEALDIQGLSVELVMSDGNNTALNEFQTNPADGYVFVEADVGQKAIEVSAEGFNASFNVNVAEADPVQTGIAVEIREGVVYYVDDEFSKESLKVEAVFDKGANQELAADQFTVSLAEDYVFQAEDVEEGVNVVVQSGTFSEQINLPVIERTWDEKLVKFLADSYDLEPYERDAQGNVVAGDYDLDAVLNFYFGAQQTYGYTADPDYDFEVGEDYSGNEYAHLSYYADEETDEVYAAFFGYLGLVDLPSYNTVYEDGQFYSIDWTEIYWDVSGIVNFMFDATMVLYSRPNENGQYVCLEFYLDAYTSIDFDIYVSVEEAYSAEEIDELLPMAMEEFGFDDTPFFGEEKSAAELSDWFYLDMDFDSEYNLKTLYLDVPVYSAQEANEALLQDAFEDALDEDAWDIDNSVAEFYGNFARSESDNGKQVVVNYQQFSDYYDSTNSSWYRNAPAEFLYNYFDLQIYVDDEVISFNEFAEEANIVLAELGFETELPGLARVKGQYTFDEDELYATFTALEPEAVESYQQKLVAALEPEEGQEPAWDVTENAGLTTALSLEASNGKLIQLQFYTDLENHQFLFAMGLVDDYAEWNQAAVEELFADFEGLVAPALEGETWLSEVGDDYVVIYTNGDKAEGAEDTYLEQLAALFEAAEGWTALDKEFAEDGETLIAFETASNGSIKPITGMDTEYRAWARAYLDEAGRFTVVFSVEIIYVDGIAYMNDLLDYCGWGYVIPEAKDVDFYVLYDQYEDGQFYYDVISEETDFMTGYNAFMDLMTSDNNLFTQFGGGYQGSNSNAFYDYYFVDGVNQLKIEVVLYGDYAQDWSQLRIYIMVEPYLLEEFPSAFVNDYLEYLGYEQRIGDVEYDAYYVGAAAWQQDDENNAYYDIMVMTMYESDEELEDLLAAYDVAFNVEGLVKDDSEAATGLITYCAADGSVQIAVQYGEGEIVIEIIMYDTEA